MGSSTSGHFGGLFLCESCSFEDVLGVWSRELWPGRVSAIEPNSAMKWLGGIDMSLMQAPATFWRVVRAPRANRRDGDEMVKQTVGVLSGHFGGVITSEDSMGGPDLVRRSYRTRGLWVAEIVRRQGVAQMLMTAAFDQATHESCPSVWTFPRKSSMPFYESRGFERVGEWIGGNDPLAGEFGPNCYAVCSL